MMFDKTNMRAEFVNLHGTDKVNAKFKIGDKVSFKVSLADIPFDWIGNVEAVNFVDEEYGYEYLIEGSPVLAWEEQLVLV